MCVGSIGGGNFVKKFHGNERGSGKMTVIFFFIQMYYKIHLLISTKYFWLNRQEEMKKNSKRSLGSFVELLISTEKNWANRRKEIEKVLKGLFVELKVKYGQICNFFDAISVKNRK